MARIRSVHPGLFSDEAFVSCSPAARLMVIGLWTEADDKGIFEWKPLTIKMRVFPADAHNIAAMQAMLDELLSANIVRQFEADGKQYGAIRNFRKYQRPQKPNDVHPITDELMNYVGLTPVIPLPVQDRSRTSQRNRNQMEDGGGKREKVTSREKAPVVTDPDGVILDDGDPVWHEGEVL